MTDRVALVRRPSSRMADGIVTFGERAGGGRRARRDAARGLCRCARAPPGWAIHEVAPADDLPDSAFVEDTVVVCGDLAVLARPGAPERRAEVAGTEEAVRALGLDVARIEEPGTLDGGDVLTVGQDPLRRAAAGARTSEGIRQLAELVAPRGFTVVTVPLREVLHLKSAITALPDGTIIAADPSLLDTSPLPALRTVPEEAGSHVVPLGGDTRADGGVRAAHGRAVRRLRASTWSRSTSASSRRWRAA